MTAHVAILRQRGQGLPFCRGSCTDATLSINRTARLGFVFCGVMASFAASALVDEVGAVTTLVVLARRALVFTAAVDFVAVRGADVGLLSGRREVTSGVFLRVGAFDLVVV